MPGGTPIMPEPRNIGGIPGIPVIGGIPGIPGTPGGIPGMPIPGGIKPLFGSSGGPPPLPAPGPKFMNGIREHSTRARARKCGNKVKVLLLMLRCSGPSLR